MHMKGSEALSLKFDTLLRPEPCQLMPCDFAQRAIWKITLIPYQMTCKRFCLEGHTKNTTSLLNTHVYIFLTSIKLKILLFDERDQLQAWLHLKHRRRSREKSLHVRNVESQKRGIKLLSAKTVIKPICSN